MLSFKDYMEKYHNGYYDEYIKYTENTKREREVFCFLANKKNGGDLYGHH